MSAFVVGKTHVDGLIKAGLELFSPSDPLRWHWGNPNRSAMLTVENASEVGQMLWNENVRSVNVLYREAESVPTYTFERLPGLVERHKHLGLVANMLSCYAYQSCESDDWPATQAWAFVYYFEQRLLSWLPGYEDGKGWELSDREAFGTAKIVSLTDLMAHNRKLPN